MCKKRLVIPVLFISVILSVCACGNEPPAAGSMSGADDQARKERLQEAAELRRQFDKSELKDYTIDHLQKLFEKTYPEIDISELVFDVYKTRPAQEEVEALDGDEDKAFELMRKADFTITITRADGSPAMDYNDRMLFLNALGMEGFTADLELGYYEYEKIVDGEVEVTPKPMY